jgi:hypothetical protein
MRRRTLTVGKGRIERHLLGDPLRYYDDERRSRGASVVPSKRLRGQELMRLMEYYLLVVLMLIWIDC